MTTRYAKVVSNSSLATIERYLPANYEALQLGSTVFIVGEDNAGWTLDDYVIPRLQSGLHTAIELTSAEYSALSRNAVVHFDPSTLNTLELADVIEAFAINRRSFPKDQADQILFEVRDRLRRLVITEEVRTV